MTDFLILEHKKPGLNSELGQWVMHLSMALGVKVQFVMDTRQSICAKIPTSMQFFEKIKTMARQTLESKVGHQ